MIKLSIRYIEIAGLTLLLSACGGGSSSGGSTPPPPLATLSWGTPEAIDSGNNPSLHPQIAMDAAGNAQALWLENDSTATQRYYAWTNQYTAGSSWGSPLEIETQTSLSSGLTYTAPSPPSIAMNSAGYAKATWEQWVNIAGTGLATYLYGIWASNYDTAIWTIPVAVEAGLGISGGGVNSLQPQAAINSNSDTVMIWNRVENVASNPQGIWASVSFDGGMPKPVSYGPASDPRINLDDAGNSVAIWRALPPGATNSNKTVWSSQYDVRTSAWNTPAPIQSMTSFNVQDAELAGNANGVVFAVVERTESNGQNNIYAAHFITSPSATFGVTGSWVYDQPLQFTQDSITAPQVAVDANGNAMAVWVQIGYLSGTRKIWASYYNMSQSQWGSPVLIDNQTGFSAESPQVAFGPAGNAIVVWAEYDAVNSSNKRIWSNEYTPASGWGAASAVESGTGYASSEPQVKIDGNGNAICVWTRTENSQARIWASRL
ncbi:MAG: hypothetical protein GC149_16415 [Gammaproteobacteria bacterium]|nr:hypothetical protein [Gammaproteobacteria bacterium]